MRPSLRLVSVAITALPVLSGCSANKPPPRPPSAINAPSQPPSPSVIETVEPARVDLVPKVIRRIAKEQKALVDSSKAMAVELTDAFGRERALVEANGLADELSAVSAELGSGDEIPSDVLDAAVTKLIALDTRISLLHEKLRVATERTTAVLAE